MEACVFFPFFFLFFPGKYLKKIGVKIAKETFSQKMFNENFDEKFTKNLCLKPLKNSLGNSLINSPRKASKNPQKISYTKKLWQTLRNRKFAENFVKKNMRQKMFSVGKLHEKIDMKLFIGANGIADQSVVLEFFLLHKLGSNKRQ